MYSVFQGILCLYLIHHCNGNLICGNSRLTEPSGYLASPGFPDGLPKAGSCKWKIDLGPTDYLTISFENFQFLSTSDRSWLAINPSLTGVERVRYTSNDPPVTPYISSAHGSTIVISMSVDQDDISARFNLTYIRGPMLPSQICPSHQFTCNNGKCILGIWVCNGYDECEDGSDEAQCFISSSTPPHEGSCPNHHFACISSATGHMSCFQEIRKCDGHSDCQNGDDEESCTSICKYILEGTSGSFTTPNYPGNYYSNLNCEWRISLGQEGIVQLRFMSFELESGFYRDYVKVTEEYVNPFTKEVVGQTELGTFYGSSQDIHSPPTVVESSGNSLIVQFYSDNSINHDGFNATFQKKGFCIDQQKSCGEEDNNCYDVEKETCDERYACKKGQDEVGCGNCTAEKIPCQLPGNDCFFPEDRCNGFTTCNPGSEDEHLCTADICGEIQGLFLCDDGTCIPETFMCNTLVDCKDRSDETDCAPTNKVVTAAVIGSLVCGMLLVAALSCTCKLYQLRNVRRDGRPPSQSPYYIHGQDEHQREAPPSYSATMASPHYAELQRAFVEGVQSLHGSSSHSSRGVSRRRSRFLRMLSRSNPASSSSIPEAACNGNPSEDVARLPPGQETQNTHNSGNTEGVFPERTDPQNTVETSSFTTSDTDSETNQDAVQQAHLDHQILNAAANIHRMRVANRMLQRQQRGRRNDPAVPGAPDNPPPSEDPATSVSSTTDAPNDGTSSSSAVTPELSSTDHAGRGQATRETVESSPSPLSAIIQNEDEFPGEHDPAIIVGVGDPGEDADDVQLLDDI